MIRMGVSYHGLSLLAFPGGLYTIFGAARKVGNWTTSLADRGFKVANIPQDLPVSQFPKSLQDLPRPPTKLYLTGSLPSKPMIAIVGTRRPTPEAERFAQILAQDIVGHGYAVASGGAAGIDTAAHRGALNASGQTLVVAPAGWHEPYPDFNRELFGEIVELGGGYLSLVEPDKRATMPQFFGRNAVLVALALATVVVQAPLRSGSRNSAHVARKLGRLLYVVPSAPWVEPGAGCVVELRLGARPLGCLGDLLAGLSELGAQGNQDPLQLELPLPKVRGKAPSDPKRWESNFDTAARLDLERDTDLAPVVVAISEGCCTLDSICIRLGWNAPNVQSALLRLTLSGHIRMTSAGRIDIISI